MRRLGFAAVAAGFLMAGAAQAAVVTLTFGGTVISGIDAGGVFGASGTDLSGDAFSAVIQINMVENVFHDLVVAPGPGALVSTWLTIGGAEVDPTDLAANGAAVAQFFFTAGDYQSLIQVGLGRPGNFIDLDFAQHYAVEDTTTPFGGSENDIGQDGLIGGAEFGVAAGTNYHLNVTSAFSDTLPTLDPMPEPGAWALMLLGFGGIGGALRSRRRAAAA